MNKYLLIFMLCIAATVQSSDTYTLDQVKEAYVQGYRDALYDLYVLCRDEQGFALEGNTGDKDFLCIEKKGDVI